MTLAEFVTVAVPADGALAGLYVDVAERLKLEDDCEIVDIVEDVSLAEYGADPTHQYSSCSELSKRTYLSKHSSRSTLQRPPPKQAKKLSSCGTDQSRQKRGTTPKKEKKEETEK